MARKRYKPEEIVSLLRQAEVLHGQCVVRRIDWAPIGVATC